MTFANVFIFLAGLFLGVLISSVLIFIIFVSTSYTLRIAGKVLSGEISIREIVPKDLVKWICAVVTAFTTIFGIYIAYLNVVESKRSNDLKVIELKMLHENITSTTGNTIELPN